MDSPNLEDLDHVVMLVVYTNILKGGRWTRDSYRAPSTQVMIFQFSICMCVCVYYNAKTDESQLVSPLYTTKLKEMEDGVTMVDKISPFS